MGGGAIKAGVLLVILALVAYIVYKFSQGKAVVSNAISDAVNTVTDAARTVGNAVNPLNENNVANTLFNSVTQHDDGRTVGSMLYDFLNEDKMRKITEPTVLPVRKSVVTVWDDDDAELGQQFRMTQFAETEGGAVTGLVRRK